MEQLQLVTCCVSSEGIWTLYLMAPQWQLASYHTLASVSEFDMAPGLRQIDVVGQRYCSLGFKAAAASVLC